MAKLKIESCPSVNVLEWKRLGYLRGHLIFARTWSCGGEPVKRLICEATPRYVILRSEEDVLGGRRKQRVDIVWTPCHFGGERPWMVCQGTSSKELCGRRVTRLFCVDSLFACRRCHRLAYASQHQPEDERNAQTAEKIRMRLAREDDVSDEFPQKPKGMHWRTYNRLHRLHDQAEEAAAQALIRIMWREAIS